jgi:hypothetical protein
MVVLSLSWNFILLLDDDQLFCFGEKPPGMATCRDYLGDLRC